MIHLRCFVWGCFAFWVFFSFFWVFLQSRTAKKKKKRCFKYILLIVLISGLHEINILRWTKPFSVIAFKRKGNN